MLGDFAFALAAGELTQHKRLPLYEGTPGASGASPAVASAARRDSWYLRRAYGPPATAEGKAVLHIM